MRRLALTAVLAIACGSTAARESPAGTWTATSIRYTSAEYPAVEMILPGCSATLVLTIDGTFEYAYVPASGLGSAFGGVWQVEGAVLKLRRTGAPRPWVLQMSLSGDTMLVETGSALYDFDGDGMSEPAGWEMRLVR